MSTNVVYNRAQLERAVEKLIKAADAQNRGSDLDRVVAQIGLAPAGVSPLASLMLLLDEDARRDLNAAVDAYRRFCGQKGVPAGDAEVFDLLQAVYRRLRG